MANPCAKCGSNGRFQPTTATQAKWAQLKSFLRETNTISGPEIPQLLSGAQEDLRGCDRELKRLKAQIVSLENRRKMVERHIAGYQSLLSPIRKILTEILRTVFGHLCIGNQVEASSITMPALTLAAVQQYVLDGATSPSPAQNLVNNLFSCHIHVRRSQRA
ncbi:hypothetical protein C8J56DRAFT_767314 [Mycena floridula]|nr:hypothetical protein C8J56DRAFT_767314 [Mycena floridula]